MKTSNLIATLAAALLFFMSMTFQSRVHYHVKKERKAGYGTLESQTREIARFNRLYVGEAIKVVFTQDSITRLKLQGPKEILDSITTNITQNELKVVLREKTRAMDSITVFVSNPGLNQLELAGGSFKNHGTLHAERFLLKMEGKSNCQLNLSAQVLEVTLEKSASLSLSGKTEHINFINQ